MVSKKKPSKKKTGRVIPKNRPAVTKPRTRKAIPARRKAVIAHVVSLYGSVYCPALGASVAFNRKTSLREAQTHSVGDRESAVMLLNIEDLLKVATKVDNLKPKPNVKQQRSFEEMIILSAKVYRMGTARITIGKYKSDVIADAPYCHYCVTRWSVRKHGAIKKTRCGPGTAPHAICTASRHRKNSK